MGSKLRSKDGEHQAVLGVPTQEEALLKDAFAVGAELFGDATASASDVAPRFLGVAVSQPQIASCQPNELDVCKRAEAIFGALLKGAQYDPGHGR